MKNLIQKFKMFEGKTIKNCYLMKDPEYVDINCLKIIFTDGAKYIIVASHGGYTPLCKDEYPDGFSLIHEVSFDMPEIKKLKRATTKDLEKL